MSYNLKVQENKIGAFKVIGTAKVGTYAANKKGYFYPAYLTMSEAVAADKKAGGKGIFETLRLYEVAGEFYLPQSDNYSSINDPKIYTLYQGDGVENPFSRIKNRLSTLIPSQLPTFVSVENTRFVSFLQAYYSFLEQNNKAQETLENLATYKDIDETAEELVELFFKTYAEDITKSDISDNRFIIKKIRELYSKKGSETSYKMLFAFLFKETIDFFYPYTVVLKPSDGLWHTDSSLKVKQIIETQNIFDFEDTLVRGESSGATAVVNKVIQINFGIFEYYELLLDTKSITGIFQANENITAIKSFSTIPPTSLEITAQLYSVISKIDIKSSGIWYSEGDSVTITDTKGKYAKAFISGVDRFGRIKSIRVLDSGFDYTTNTKIDPGLPSQKLYGKYTLQKGTVTVTLNTVHGLVKGNRINVEYTGNVFSAVNDTSHDSVILSTPSPKVIRFRHPGA